MTPALRFLAVALVATAVDIGLLVVLRVHLGWILVVANVVAIGVASVVSYTLHRVTGARSPYRRWVRYPWAFAGIAAVAALVDTVVLRATFAATGFEGTGGTIVAKTWSVVAAVAVRAVGYRYVLSGSIRDARAHLDGPVAPSEGTVRFSVVIPAFREPDRIGATVAAVRDEFTDLGADLEIVVVDDGSGDATADAALAAGADQVIVLPRNRGKGGAVRAGMLAARGRAVAFTDADLAYDPPHLRRVLDAIEDGWDVAIGNRQHPDSVLDGGGLLRSVGSRIVNRLAQAVLLARPRDTQCGLKGFRGDVARSIFARTHIDGFAFDIEVLHLVERDELHLVELPVHLVDPGGGSTVNIVQDVLRLSRDLFRVRQHSMRGDYDARSPVETNSG